MMDSFYIELSSNASYYSNTCSNFKNQIKLLHSLEGNWEFGIAEISYTKSWYNLRYHCTLGLEKMHQQFVPFFSLANTIGYVPMETRIGTVRRGYYDTIQMLIQEIVIELEAWRDDKTDYMPKFYFDKVTKIISIKPGQDKEKNFILPALTEELSAMLGFDEYNISKPKYNQYNYMVGDRPADLTNGIRSLFVYCNLGIPQYIGDVRTKLLRTVEIPNNVRYGEQVVIKYDTPHYIPLITNDFEEIEINIKDDMNEDIKFKFGRTLIKLHLRKING